jgi:DNA polymerase-3 subunit delta
MALILRQVRLLLRAKSLLEAGHGPNELAQQLAVPPFVGRKLERQARRFSMGFLVTALKRLGELDTQIKSGEIDDGLAIDLFVAAMTGAAAGSARRPATVAQA